MGIGKDLILLKLVLSNNFMNVGNGYLVLKKI